MKIIRGQRWLVNVNYNLFIVEVIDETMNKFLIGKVLWTHCSFEKNNIYTFGGPRNETGWSLLINQSNLKEIK